jgi:hypothetical protein
MAADERHGALAEVFEIGGKTYYVRREFDLAARIEARCGPLSDILREIREGNREVARLKVVKIADVLEEALRGQLTRREIEEWIIYTGPLRAMGPVANLILNFFLGDERFMQRLEARRESEAAPDPQTAASSHGPTYLERLPG